MWEFRNGQWFNGPTPSPVGPPIGAAFWVTDANGMRDFRTFDGTNAPVATEIIQTNAFVRPINSYAAVGPVASRPMTPEEATRQQQARIAAMASGGNTRPVTAVPQSGGFMFESGDRPPNQITVNGLSTGGKPYGNDDIAINKTPPLVLLLQERAALPPEQQAIWDADPKNIERIAVARRMEAGLPPNPTTPPVATVNAPPAVVPTRPRPQGIEGYVPPMTTSGGPLNQDRTNLFTPPSMAEPRQVNYTTQDMFTPDPNPTNLFQRIDQEGMFGNGDTNILSNAQGNTFDRNLIASIADAMKNSNPTDAARAARVMNVLSNPAILGNVPIRKNGGPTDLISQAGAMFDAEHYGPQRRVAPVVTPEEEAANIAAGRDKGPNSPFRRMSRMSEGTMSDNPFMRYPGGSVPISYAKRLLDTTVMNAAQQPGTFSSRDIAMANAALQQSVLNAAQKPPPLSPPGAPRRSVAPIGEAFSTTTNPFMRGGVASPVNPFVRRFAEGTDWLSQRSPAYQAAYRQYMTANPNRGDVNARRAGENAERVEIYGRNVRAKPTGVVNPPPVVTGPRIPNGWRAIGTGGTSYDLEKYKYWAQQMGYDWREVTSEDEYLQSIGVLPKKNGDAWKDNPPADKTPVVDKPRLNPQVIWYDGDVWKDLPSLNALNNTQQINPFSRLGSRSSYDPATETTIQAPEKMNAFTMMQIDRDPQQLDVMNSIYDRHGRNWEKEYADAIRAAPMGNATRYVKTG